MAPLIPPSSGSPPIPPPSVIKQFIDLRTGQLTVPARMFLQLLWASLQGQGGVFDVISGSPPSPPTPGTGTTVQAPPSGAASEDPGPDQSVPLDQLVAALTGIDDLAAALAAQKIDLSSLLNDQIDEASFAFHAPHAADEVTADRPPPIPNGEVDVLELTGGARILTGSGDPNGVVFGSPPDLYLNYAGGAGTTLFVKESGAATDTGWTGK